MRSLGRTLGERESTVRGLASLACLGLIVLGVILYQIDARAAGGIFHPSSALMAKLVMWRWGVASIIAGALGWVLLACTENPSFADSLRRHKDYAEEDEDDWDCDDQGCSERAMKDASRWLRQFRRVAPHLL